MKNIKPATEVLVKIFEYTWVESVIGEGSSSED